MEPRVMVLSPENTLGDCVTCITEAIQYRQFSTEKTLSEEKAVNGAEMWRKTYPAPARFT
ncbi:hypothetical protein N7454_004890 [Penicillium verhagenii]|nr:hypothetical protein N7454_004890 [Penicillium verhagenii]